MLKNLLILFLLLLFIPVFVLAQEEQEVNYRRIDPNNLPLPENYQLPKEQVFPLGWNSNTLGKLTNSAGVWTELNPKVPRVDYIGLDFINADTGWACGGSGAIIKTTNGGEGWTISETPVTNLLLKIHSHNGQVVIATGYDGLILRSSDGGENFVEVPSGVGNGIDLWGVQMLNDTLGWVCGMFQTLLKTTDAGLTWQFVTPGLNQHYWSLEFLTEQYGFVVCGGGKVLKTTDGGTSWQQYQAGDTRSLYTIDVIDLSHIAAAGGDGKNVYSSDGGITWLTNPDLPAIQGTNWIEFVDRNTGYSVQDVWEMRKTTNRGQNWFNPNITNLGGEWQIELINSSTGYSSGNALSIYKRTDGFDNWEELFLNDDLVDVHFTNDLTGYFVGSTELGGPVYKTTDGGLYLIALENFPSDEFDLLRCITFTDSLTAFVGGYKSKIAKTTNAGLNWNLVNITGLTDTIGAIVQIFFINRNVGWAVTTRGGIINTTDGGDNWIAQLNLPTGIFSSVYFVDSLYGWASILGKRPYRTTDGGQNWFEQTNLNIWESRDIHFRDSLNGFILESNELYESTDAGVTWILNPEVTGFSIAAKFSYYGGNFIFITGYTTYRTTNGGEDWVEFNELNGIRINGLSLLNEGLGYAGGEMGLVMQYFDSTYIPVELISFQGDVINNKASLRWQTATEINNEGFEVERRRSISQIWGQIGFVAGHGTTTEEHIYLFTDEIEIPGNYYYRLKQIDYNGTFEYSKIIEVTFNSPLQYNLAHNYPNPFNFSTIISYQIPKDEFITLKVYDVLGNEVATLIEENKKAGYYKETFSAGEFSSGVYFYKLTASEYNSTKKLILLK